MFDTLYTENGIFSVELKCRSNNHKMIWSLMKEIILRLGEGEPCLYAWLRYVTVIQQTEQKCLAKYLMKLTLKHDKFMYNMFLK